MNIFRKYLCCIIDCEKPIIITASINPTSVPKPILKPKLKKTVITPPTVTSTKGLNLIKEFEGFSSEPYWDKTGRVWTIGYGNTGKGIDRHTPPISHLKAEALLRTHVAMVERAVRMLVTVPINQNQFDALVCFAYNVGTDIDADEKAEGLGDSSLLRYLNRSQYERAANEFPKWCFSGGKKLNGLVRRRQAEKELFLDGSIDI